MLGDEVVHLRLHTKLCGATNSNSEKRWATAQSFYASEERLEVVRLRSVAYDVMHRVQCAPYVYTLCVKLGMNALDVCLDAV